ncbi:DUF914-domain-containing protein [Backusella circina FSU 941]|nr:DUF914-domain-containing protein [Backusella circina FSU 941]
MVKSKTVLAVILGQLLSLCITGTSFASSSLWNHFEISIPFTQNLCNYILLTCVYGSTLLLSREKYNRQSSTMQFLGFSMADVLANGTAVLAFKNTSVLSALVLNSWTIPCIMLFSAYFLHTKYHRVHFKSAFICLSGLAMLIYGDTINNDEATVNHSWIGDIVCLSSATLYAASNVTEEHLVKHHTSTEFLGKAGCWGTLLCGILAVYFEYDLVIHITWSWSVLSLISMYVLCLFCMYSLVPTVYRMAGATFLSISLITSNFYSLVVGIFFLDAKMPPFYPVAYALVLVGVTLYSLAPPPLSDDDTNEEYQPIIHHSPKDIPHDSYLFYLQKIFTRGDILQLTCSISKSKWAKTSYQNGLATLFSEKSMNANSREKNMNFLWNYRQSKEENRI